VASLDNNEDLQNPWDNTKY